MYLAGHLDRECPKVISSPELGDLFSPRIATYTTELRNCSI